MTQEINQRIEELLKNNKVILFMKGTPVSPQCGFSARAVSILTEYGIPFTSYNILEDEAIRQGLKEFSNWPTYPQLYVNGELVGGCDIIVEMHESGDLAETLKK